MEQVSIKRPCSVQSQLFMATRSIEMREIWDETEMQTGLSKFEWVLVVIILVVLGSIAKLVLD